jgi:tetratricopeptide (TPR) repeat protein
MCRKYLFLRIVVMVGLFLPFLSQVTPSQQKHPQSRILAELERAVDRGSAEDERRITDFAVANPNDAKALELLARLRFRQGRITEAKALFQRVLKLDPASASAKISSGRIAVMLGQKDEARQALLSVEDANSLAPQLRLDLAATLLLIGEIQRSMELVETLPANIKTSTALPLLGSLYLRSGQSAKLTALMPAMKKAASADAALAIACAEVLQDASQFKDAIAVLSAVKNLQTEPKALVLLARLEVLSRDITHAREHLKRAAILKPDSVDVLAAQAFLENASGNLAEAFKLISRARELAPNSPVILTDYVVVAMRYGSSSLAVDAAKTLTTLDPASPEFRYLYGAASLQAGHLDTAQKLLEGYVKERPSDSRGCLALGMTYAGRPNQIDKARQQLKHCSDINPSNVEVKYQLGLSYKSQGENKEAIGLLEAVIQQDPNYALALRDLGTLYLETGDLVKARPLLEKAADLSPKDADTHFQLARLYSQIGEDDLAKKHQKIFRQLRDPGGKTSQ